MTAPRCTRHPDVETRLTCSACGTPICPDCLVDAAVSYQCPDCAEARGQRVPTPTRRRKRPKPNPDTSDTPTRPTKDGDSLPTGVGIRATAAAIGGSMAGGLLLGPVLLGGTFFLLSSGVIGWGIARLVFVASQERTSPYLRAIALTAAGFSVAIALVVAGQATAPPGILFLAYPAAVYGGWIVVRQR